MFYLKIMFFVDYIHVHVPKTELCSMPQSFRNHNKSTSVHKLHLNAYVMICFQQLQTSNIVQKLFGTKPNNYWTVQKLLGTKPNTYWTVQKFWVQNPIIIGQSKSCWVQNPIIIGQSKSCWVPNPINETLIGIDFIYIQQCSSQDNSILTVCWSTLEQQQLRVAS